MKKIIFIIMLYISCIGIINAKDNFYINSNNVKIDYNKYTELCNIYSEDFVEFMEQDFYDNIKKLNKEEFEIVENFTTPLSLEVTTEYKNLRFVKVGSQITLILKWLKIPSTRSYDVIGIRYDGIKTSNYSFNKYYTLNGSKKNMSTNSYISFSNGYGTSFKIPDGNITTLETSLSFKVSGTGTIYGTYQHAQQYLTLNDSKKYTISKDGYGSVLKFDSTIKSKYDNMSGINISL